MGRATESPEHPYVAILGGAKVSDKIGVFENLIEKVDVFLVGGGMAFAFLKAGGGEIGESLLEEGSVETAQEILASAGRAGRRVVLPSDVVIAREASAEAESRIADARRIPKGWKGLDVGPASIEAFAAEVSGASMIVWNGPLGVFELEPFAAGTMKIARAVAARTASGAISIIGGGDSAAAVVLAGVADSITHISTGGGASLMFLEGKALPAVEVLSEAH